MAGCANDLDARMREIINTIRGAGLTAQERQEQTAEYWRLVEERRKEISSAERQKPKEERPKMAKLLAFKTAKLRSLVHELNDPGGRSIMTLVPELAAALRSRKNNRDVEALLLAILNSRATTQHKWLT